MDPQKLAETLKMDPRKLTENLGLDAGTSKKAEGMLSSARDWIYMIGSVMYVISPVDLIPEAVFGVFGLADDFLVILFAVLYFYNKRKGSSSQNFKNKFK